MNNVLPEHALVRLLRPLRQQGLAVGAVGTLVGVYEGDPRSYEVEFADRHGVTLALVVLEGDAVEPAFSWELDAWRASRSL